MLHKPVLDGSAHDELAETAAVNPKRLATIVEKMYVHFLKSAASLGNQGMKLVPYHSTLKQSMSQEGESLLNLDMRCREWRG